MSEDTQGEFRGYDDEGHKVVVAWNTENDGEYLVGTTFCCGASSKATEAGIVCRRCYEPCEMSLAADARVVRGPEDGTLVVVARDGWGMKNIDGRWTSVPPSEFVVYERENVVFDGTLAECHEYVAGRAVTV